MAAQIINLGSIDNTLTLGDSDYVITGGNGNNTLTLGGGTDQLTLGNGNNTLTLGGGTDQITAGSGNNSITTTGTGADTITLTGGNNTVVAGNGPDVIQAGNGLNIVTAGNGNDTVTLGNGFDQLSTGNGNSAITVGNGVGDTVTVGTGANTIAIGIGGADTVHTGSGGNIVSVSAAAVATDSILGGLTTGNGAGNQLVLTTAGPLSVPGVAGFQIYQLANGGSNNLTLTNANFADLPGATITVQDGNSGDTVNAAGLAAANAVIVNAGTGADVLVGGAGNDVFNVGDLAFSSINGGAGTNTLALSSSGLTLTLGSLGNRLQNIEVINLTGTGANTLTVSAADVLNLSGTTHTLKVEGNAADAVTLLGTGWITGATSGGFTTYTNGQATLQLSTALTDVGGTGLPVFVNNNALSVPVAGTTTITASNLSVTDPNFTASQLTYSVKTSPSDGTLLKNGVATGSFTQADINGGLITYHENGTVAASDTFSVVVTDPAGNSVSGSLPVQIQSVVTTGAAVAAYYQAILRVPPPGGATGTYATTEAADITAGSPTVVNYVASLIGLDQALYTTIAALDTVDAFYNATPSSALLTTIATATSGTSYLSAAELHNVGYSDPNVWTILAANWGADPTSQFAGLYGADATGTTSGYTTFINAAYQREFGFAPAAPNLQTLLNDVPGVTALLSGTGDMATPIQVMSGLEGYLLYVGQTNGIGQYAASTNAFLQAAANGTVVYGPELNQEFPATSQLLTGALASAPGAASNGSVGSSIITVTSADQLTNPGTGGNTIQFMTSAGADTPVASLGGAGPTAGFGPGSDGPGLGSLLSAAGVDLKSGIAVLGNHPAITDQGSNGMAGFNPAAPGGGSAFAVLPGPASAVTGVASLLTQDAFRLG